MTEQEMQQKEAREQSRLLVRETPITGVPQSLAQAIEIGKVLSASGLYPDYATGQKATAAIIIGAQYGLSPAQSLSAVHIVKGKPMLHYALILAKVREHPDYDYKIISATDDLGEVEFLRHDAVCGRERFTIQQAKRQGTGNLDKYPDTMLLARAVSKGVKKFCPDVLNGMVSYVQGEIEESDAGFSHHATKGDSLREQMKQKASEIMDAEFRDASNDEPNLDDQEEEEVVDSLAEFNLTELQLHDFTTMAEAVGYDLNQVAKDCETKTAEALESALSQGNLL